MKGGSMNFICPKCRGRLSVFEDGSAKCPSGHSFDRSKEGYYNLLLSQGSGAHGDNREMLLARRSFLNTEAYRPLADTVTREILAYTDASSLILDMGCGEGYYTNLFETALRASHGESHLLAFDISKEAVRLAAKLNKNVSFAVASSYHAPIADETIDVAVNIFSPLALDESLRVLKKGGVFVMAIPDREHLWGLKAAVYDTPYKNELADTSLSGFKLVSEKRLSYPLSLNSGEKINALFMMTPYAYRTSKQERDRLSKLNFLECNAEFVILTYKKL